LQLPQLLTKMTCYNGALGRCSLNNNDNPVTTLRHKDTVTRPADIFSSCCVGHVLPSNMRLAGFETRATDTLPIIDIIEADRSGEEV
jgi:hypothetical protein